MLGNLIRYPASNPLLIAKVDLIKSVECFSKSIHKKIDRHRLPMETSLFSALFTHLLEMAGGKKLIDRIAFETVLTSANTTVSALEKHICKKRNFPLI